MISIFYEKFRLFFIGKGELFLYLLFQQAIYNIFMFRIRYEKFNGRFFEKALNSTFFLLGVNFIITIFIYYFPIVKYFVLLLISLPNFY